MLTRDEVADVAVALEVVAVEAEVLEMATRSGKLRIEEVMEVGVMVARGVTLWDRLRTFTASLEMVVQCIEDTTHTTPEVNGPMAMVVKVRIEDSLDLEDRDRDIPNSSEDAETSMLEVHPSLLKCCRLSH